MLSITIDDENFKKTFRRMRRRLSDFSLPMDQAVQRLDRFVRNTFETMTDPWGVRWADWRPATEANRQRRENFEAGILRDSYAMFNNIDREFGGDFGVVYVKGDLPYVDAQQFGNPNNKAWGGVSAPIPARAFFPMRNPDEAAFPDDWMREVFEPFELALQEAAK